MLWFGAFRSGDSSRVWS